MSAQPPPVATIYYGDPHKHWSNAQEIKPGIWIVEAHKTPGQQANRKILAIRSNPQSRLGWEYVGEITPARYRWSTMNLTAGERIFKIQGKDRGWLGSELVRLIKEFVQ